MCEACIEPAYVSCQRLKLQRFIFIVLWSFSFGFCLVTILAFVNYPRLISHLRKRCASS